LRYITCINKYYRTKTILRSESYSFIDKHYFLYFFVFLCSTYLVAFFFADSLVRKIGLMYIFLQVPPPSRVSWTIINKIFIARFSRGVRLMAGTVLYLDENPIKNLPPSLLTAIDISVYLTLFLYFYELNFRCYSYRIRTILVTYFVRTHCCFYVLLLHTLTVLGLIYVYLVI